LRLNNEPNWSNVILPNVIPNFLDFNTREVPGANPLSSTNNSGLRADYYSNENRLRLREAKLVADKYQFKYKTKSSGVWSGWTISPQSTDEIVNIYNLDNVIAAKVKGRVHSCGFWSNWSAPKTFIFSNPLRLDKSTDKKVQIYPNPANQQIRVDISGNIVEGSTISIYDVAGKQVQQSALMPLQKSIQLNVEDLANGIYLIEVNTDEDKIYTQKLTIAH